MRAVQIVTLDGPKAVEVRDVPAPDPGEHVLVEVRAAGLNFPDLLQTRGLYQYEPERPYTLGSEVAGVVLAAPEGADVRVGDRVAAFCGTGGAAEQVAVSPDMVFPLPDDVSFTAGAAMPMNYLTAHFALRVRTELKPGQTVLVHGAAGGVGTAVTQLATALGAHVIAVVSSEAKAEIARRAGATDTVAVEGFKDAVQELTGGRGVDLVVDPVGGDRFTDSLRSLAPFGKLLVVGFTAGEIPTVKVNRLLLNNIDVVGVGWGAFAFDRPGYAVDQWNQLLPHMDRLIPLVDVVLPLEQAADGLVRIDERRVLGKVVLEP
ncbi:NADPH2:quinone reductase [Pseudonocardia thermophila]|jgi:NADPH:quinone reductase and related Zn-dependent oxidoreductases|uniref:NADPH2:quinone reductase n=1 Tax=Pseudonocardia thermophila TaxID=1848 RepID=A0A1M6R910_PSETH|nr:NADPH:quinone oxidoreductase family protein [Pseudonocardia thermophila]SHK28941.1 NADPH2:quinone reductase [Pseudonocardia thermophila]